MISPESIDELFIWVIPFPSTLMVYSVLPPFAFIYPVRKPGIPAYPALGRDPLPVGRGSVDR